jgi:hypothetical protein
MEAAMMEAVVRSAAVLHVLGCAWKRVLMEEAQDVRGAVQELSVCVSGMVDDSMVSGCLSSATYIIKWRCKVQQEMHIGLHRIDAGGAATDLCFFRVFQLVEILT